MIPTDQQGGLADRIGRCPTTIDTLVEEIVPKCAD